MPKGSDPWRHWNDYGVIWVYRWWMFPWVWLRIHARRLWCRLRRKRLKQGVGHCCARVVQVPIFSTNDPGVSDEQKDSTVLPVRRS